MFRFSPSEVLFRLRSDFDWPLAFAIGAILAIGLVNLYSATLAVRPALFTQQLVWIGIGLLVFFTVAAIDFRTLNRLGYVGWLIGCAALLAVRLFGHSSHGAKRWIVVFGQWIQPSEFAKVFLIFALAKYAQERSLGAVSSVKRWIFPTLCIGIPAVLILKQPDLGTAMLLMLVFASMMAFVDFKYLAIACGLGALASPLIWFGLKPYQKDRLLVHFHAGADPSGAGWHARQSIFAVGSGRFFGKGYLHGTQNQLNFLPEHWTDFPFAVWAEEWGFVGCFLLLAIYAFLVLWILALAVNARDRFGQVACVGVAGLVFWHAIINVSMVSGVLPVVGVTLPLFSYGGSSLLTIMVALGLAMSISIRRHGY